MHRVNARGVFLCLQAVARQMVPQRSGSIINIASIAGKGYRHTSNIAYAASKGAVVVMTQVAAFDDIAAMAVFLASEEARHITGQALNTEMKILSVMTARRQKYFPLLTPETTFLYDSACCLCC